MKASVGFPVVNRQAAMAAALPHPAFKGISDDRYTVRLARTPKEAETALKLRFEVFNLELARVEAAADSPGLEFDAYDFKCRHLIVIENSTNRTVGTYRLNSIESTGNARGFYSYNEFSIEDLPHEVLEQGIEIGRACIAPEHRNTKVLFLLWKGLANYLMRSDKRFFFGCCSIFTHEAYVGEKAYRQLVEGGHFHKTLRVEPRKNGLYYSEHAPFLGDAVELPSLFNMYLRIGAKVCGPPMIDHDFGTIDFFVVFDVTKINDKYRKMFFS